MTTPDGLADAEFITDIFHNPNFESADNDEPTASQDELGDKRWREVQAKIKSNLLTRLLRDVDVLVYCELSILYYMEYVGNSSKRRPLSPIQITNISFCLDFSCSLLHFAIRAMIQLLFFTPKAGPFAEPPKGQPYVGAILTSNLACMFLHYISANPTAGESTRGYLHGGLFIDFIGQKGPISRTQLFMNDVLIIILQVIMLGITLENEKTKGLIASNSTSSPSAAETPAEPSPPQLQDHDAEERGVRESVPGVGSGSGSADDTDGIELQPLRAEDTIRSSVDGESPLAGEGEPRHGRNEHPRDHFHSGEAVIMDMSVRRTISEQWGSSAAATNAQPSAASLAERRNAFFRQRLGMHLGRAF